MFEEESKFFQSKLKKDSLLKFAFEQGFLRLGSEATLVIVLLILLRKTTLTELEFVLPVLLGPLIGFLYCAFIWWIKHDKAEDSDT